jgi:hypothetical protein
MRRRVSIVVALLLTLAAVGGPSQARAAAPCQKHQIRPDGEAPLSLRDNPTNGDLIDGVAALVRDRLGLPLPAASTAYVCPDEAALTEEILRNLGVGGLRAWGSMSGALGIATRVGIFLRGDYLGRADLAGRVAVVAHELAHMSQTQLARSGQREIPSWIMEGHAEWVAFRVLDVLGLRPYGVSRDRVALSLVASKTPIKLFPDLSELTARTLGTRWVELGHAATYGQAFLAVDWLVAQYGSAKLVEYLGRFELTADSHECWEAVFPIPYAEFVADFRVHLKGLVPSHGVDDVEDMAGHG